jgi:hypothetical protein
MVARKSAKCMWEYRRYGKARMTLNRQVFYGNEKANNHLELVSLAQENHINNSIEFASDRRLLLKGWWCISEDKSENTKNTKNLEPVP